MFVQRSGRMSTGRRKGILEANNDKEQESKGSINTTIRIAMAATTTLSKHYTDDDLYYDQRDSSVLLLAYESHSTKRTLVSLRRDFVQCTRWQCGLNEKDGKENINKHVQIQLITKLTCSIQSFLQLARTRYHCSPDGESTRWLHPACSSSLQVAQQQHAGLQESAES